MFIFAFILIIIFSLFLKNDLGGYGDDDWNGDDEETHLCFNL